ncbi:MAG: hypothetical protein WDZ49_17435 [Litorilinea sp.]
MTIYWPLTVAGLFTVTLGIIHFWFPILLDFAHAIPRAGTTIRPFRLGPIRYATLRSDVHGIAWVMNHAASYALVGIGLLDLFAGAWLDHPASKWLLLWIAGWWILRSGAQFYLGRRPGDWLIAGGFLLLAFVHLVYALWYALGYAL